MSVGWTTDTEAGTETATGPTSLPVWVREDGDTTGKWWFDRHDTYGLVMDWVPNSNGVARNTRDLIVPQINRTAAWVTNMQVTVHVRAAKP